MKNLYLYFVIISAFVLSSCHTNRGKDVLPLELIQAENIMYENPDSALQTLQAMEIPTEKEAHATWALLLTQAKYKCDVEIWYDYLDEAYEYFHARHDMQKKALVAYHQGIYYRLHKKEVEKALEFYMQANESVVLSSDYRLGHLINIHISFIYVYQKLYQYAEEYCLKAKEYALLSCDNYYISHSYLNLARIYSVQKDNEKSIDYYNKALDIAKQIENKKNRDLLVSTELTEISNLYAYQQEYDKSLIAIKEAMQINSTKQQLLVVGNLYYKMNQTDSAYFYLEQAVKSDNIYTVKTAYQVLYALSKKVKDYERFVDYSSKLRTVTDSIYKLTNNKALIEMQEKYDQQKAINDKDKAEKRTLFVFCFSFCIIALIIVCYQWKVIRQNKELETMRHELNDLNLQLNDNISKIVQNEERMKALSAQVKQNEETAESQAEKEIAIEKMQQQNKEIETKNEELLKKIEIYETKLKEKSYDNERLNLLAEKNMYLHKREVYLTNQLQKKDGMIAKLKNSPQYLSNEQWAELKERTDAIYDKYTERLLNEMPTLTEHDIRICCLIKLSFTNGEIADVLGISPASVARQKMRVKNKIAQGGNLGENMLLDIWLKEL